MHVILTMNANTITVRPNNAFLIMAAIKNTVAYHVAK